MTVLTKEILDELLTYCPDSGKFFRKKRSPDSFSSLKGYRVYKTKYEGREAGRIWVRPDGYRAVTMALGGKTHYAHRIAWVMMTGKEPPVAIDHINRDATDNRWCNLRGSDYARNNRNASIMRNNTSGHPCVYWRKDINKWRANVHFEGRGYFLGHFVNKESAALAVDKFHSKMGFSEGHGKHSRPYEVKND